MLLVGDGLERQEMEHAVKKLRLDDVCLFTGAPGEVCPLGLTPTTSTTLMTVIGDILVVGAMEATHFDAHQYALRHHGGYLGTRSREQSQQHKD